MLLKRIKSSTDMVYFLANIDTPMAVKGFLFRVKGTSAGTAVGIKDVGRMFMRRRGDVRVSIDFDAMQIVDDLEYGFPERTGDAAIGAYAFSCYIPRALPGSKDVEYIEPDDNYTFEVTFGAAINSFSSAFVAELYADIDVGVCWYDLQILQTNFSFPSAGTYAESISAENIVASYLTAQVSTVKTTVASVITELSAEWGKNHGSGILASWISLNQMRKRLEAAYLLGATIHTAEGEISGALEDKLGLGFTVSAASYPIVIGVGMKFNQDKLIITRAQDGTALATKLAEKDRSGHAQSSAVIKSALGQE